MVATFLPPFIEPAALLPQLRERGYAVLAPAGVAALCGFDHGALDGLKPAWDDLQPDRYLKDGGSYRKRRHSCFVADEAAGPGAASRALAVARNTTPCTAACAAGSSRCGPRWSRSRPGRDCCRRWLQVCTALEGRAALVRGSAPVPHRHRRRHRPAHAGRRAPRRRGFRGGAAGRPRMASAAAKPAYSMPTARMASASP